MVKNKVVLKERDVWSNLANFIGEMVVKYAEAMDLDKLPDPDFYLCRERIRQLYTELLLIHMPVKQIFQMLLYLVRLQSNGKIIIRIKGGCAL